MTRVSCRLSNTIEDGDCRLLVALTRHVTRSLEEAALLFTRGMSLSGIGMQNGRMIPSFDGES